MRNLLIASFRQPVKVDKKCEFCNGNRTFMQQHYMNTTPEILILKIINPEGSKRKIKVNKLIFLDDIWAIDRKNRQLTYLGNLLIGKSIEDKIKNQKQESSSLNVSGFEIFGIIAIKEEEKQNSYTAYLNPGNNRL